MGRGVARPAVVVWVALALGAGVITTVRLGGGAGEPVRGPISILNAEAEAPAITKSGGVLYVESTSAAEHLVVDSIHPTRASRLLFFQGAPAQPIPGGGALALDGAGGILRVDERLRVSRIPVHVDGREVVSVAAAGEAGLWLVTGQGEVVLLDRAGTVVSRVPGAFDYSLVASDVQGRAWLVRSPMQMAFRPVFGSTHLLARLDALGEVDTTIGAGVVPPDFLLTHLASAGRIALADTVIYYAPFIRDELVAMTRSGDTLWVASRGLPQSTVEPRFEVVDGEAMIDYAPVNIGVALGVDGRVYVLSVPGFTTQESRIDVFDPETGHLLRSATIDNPLPTLASDAEGRVYLVDHFALLTGVPPSERAPFGEFDLELLDGRRVTSQDLRGKVVLINFWASWCAPCRVEMPALDSLRHSITHPDFEFVTFNEDIRVASAESFLDEFGFDFPVALGRGDLKSKYHYIGLPFTVLLDRDGRVVERWIGFAGEEQMQAIRSIITAELDREGTMIMDHGDDSMREGGMTHSMGQGH
ncbi:MAG: TlpA family protein disulfide reductase [Gemmatimonadetes bacterium]|nr:TlpA family protein disulfide reductase [Gemmatimonadota bacterium]